MIRYTSKEYKEGFDIKMSEYLLAFEDNTHLSFLDLQKELFTSFRDALLSIANELKKFGEQEAKNIFLSNTVFIDLKNISNEIYRDIRLEEKFQFANYRFKTLLEELDDINSNPENFCTRIDYNKLKNHLTSAKKILNFIEGKYQIIEQEERQIINLALGQQDAQSNGESIISAEPEPIELETIDQVDPNKSKKEIIEKYLKEFTDYLSPEDYLLLTDSLLKYFLNGKFPKLNRKITFKKINIKKVGWALKEVYKSFETEKLNITFLGFAVENINLFSKYKISKDNLFRSNIYKAFTTNPKSYNYN